MNFGQFILLIGRQTYLLPTCHILRCVLPLGLNLGCQLEHIVILSRAALVFSSAEAQHQKVLLIAGFSLFYRCKLKNIFSVKSSFLNRVFNLVRAHKIYVPLSYISRRPPSTPFIIYSLRLQFSLAALINK